VKDVREKVVKNKKIEITNNNSSLVLLLSKRRIATLY
jgi:hypothetical protein